jgi:hypothetical protein
MVSVNLSQLMESRNWEKRFGTCDVNSRLKQLLQVAVISVCIGFDKLNITFLVKTEMEDALPFQYV